MLFETSLLNKLKQRHLVVASKLKSYEKNFSILI